MAKKEYKQVRVYADAHANLAALTEQASSEWGYKNLTMTEYLSKLINQTAERTLGAELEYDRRRRASDQVVGA